VIAHLKRRLQTLRGSTGQALPVAIGALALGAVLVTPLLQGAGTSSRATNLVGQRAHDRYSMDAGIEWSGWRLISDPRLTTDTIFTDAPLQPFPPAINGGPFPVTEIRYVAGAGNVEAQQPAWTYAGPDTCYTFSASEAGVLSVRVTTGASEVWVALLDDTDPCARPAGPALPGGSPFGADFTIASPGTYQVLIGIDAPAAGTLEMSVPAATYEVRSVAGGRDTTARIIAGYSGVRVTSWQLN